MPKRGLKLKKKKCLEDVQGVHITRKCYPDVMLWCYFVLCFVDDVLCMLLVLFAYINATLRETAARSGICGTFVLMTSVRDHATFQLFIYLKKIERADRTLILTCNCLSDCSKNIYVPVSSHGHVMTSPKCFL